MDLESAIKHAEEVAEENNKCAEHIRDKMKSEIALSNATECETCADEHRQLAEWLKELKKFREQYPCEGCIIEWKKDFKEYVNSLSIPRDDYKGIMEYIDELPVTPQPKIGRWKKMVSVYDMIEGKYRMIPYTHKDEELSNPPFYVCDCGHNSNKPTNYCPDCGTKMLEVEE